MKPTDFRKKSNLGLYGLGLLIKYETKAFFENKGSVLSLLLTPILFFVFISTGISRMTGNVIYLVLGQMSQTIYRTTIDKKYGLLALKLLSGIKPFYYVIGMSTYAMLGLSVQMFALIILANFFGIHYSLMKIGVMIVIIILTLLFWSALAVAITLRISNYQVRDNILSFVITPLSFTAPVFYVLDYAPLWMKWLAKINPVTYQLGALRQGVMLNQYFQSIIILLVFALAATALSSNLVAKSKLNLTEY